MSGQRRTTAEVGQRGEALIASQLADQGFLILGRNVRVGRLELDIIAQRDDVVVFVEVRTRTERRIADPFESIDRAKIMRLRRAAARWLAEARATGKIGGELSVRFDVASVVLCPEASRGAPAANPGARVDYFEDAF